MAAIDEIVQVQIKVEGATLTKPGFGVPLIAAFHTFWPERVRTFGSLAELTDAGATSTSPVVLAATALFSQTFTPTLFKVGKRLSAPANAYTLTPTDTTEGVVYSFTAALGGLPVTSITHTNGAAETVAAIVTALQTQIDAITDISATDNTTDLKVDADTPGDLLSIVGWDASILDVEDITTDPGLAADLDAIDGVDSNWYGLLLDSNSSAECQVAASWAQARIKLFGCDNQDPDNADPISTMDLMFLLNSNSYSRTYCIWDKNHSLDYGGAAWMGELFPTLPGSATWKFKTLAGITTDPVKGGEREAIKAKKGNFYHVVAGAAITQEGTTSSGQFIDITRGIDWLQAEVQINVFDLLASQDKVPFTDAGVDQIRAAILQAINQGISNGLLADDPTPTVTAPLVADISPNDKGNRLLPDVEFTATLAGAVHKVIIQGKVSV